MLELTVGTGSVVHFLSPVNRYVGVDISPVLLRRAVNKLRAAGFREADLYAASADDLPFDGETFDLCLCILSLHFFDDLQRVAREAHRVLTDGAMFLCVVPVPERNARGCAIRGTMRSEAMLRDVFEGDGFSFQTLPYAKGALLYFQGRKMHAPNRASA